MQKLNSKMLIFKLRAIFQIVHLFLKMRFLCNFYTISQFIIIKCQFFYSSLLQYQIYALHLFDQNSIFLR